MALDLPWIPDVIRDWRNRDTANRSIEEDIYEGRSVFGAVLKYAPDVAKPGDTTVKAWFGGLIGQRIPDNVDELELIMHRRSVEAAKTAVEDVDRLRSKWHAILASLEIVPVSKVRALAQAWVRLDPLRRNFSFNADNPASGVVKLTQVYADSDPDSSDSTRLDAFAWVGDGGSYAMPTTVEELELLMNKHCKADAWERTEQVAKRLRVLKRGQRFAEKLKSE